jgi:hypothetical protein
MLEKMFDPYESSLLEEGNGVMVTSYRIICKSMFINQTFSWDCNDDLTPILKCSIHKLIAVLSNGEKFDSQKVYDNKILESFIENNYIKLAPEAKLNSILEYVSKQSNYEGEAIILKYPNLLEAVKMYFSNTEEWVFYLKTAINQKFIRQQTVEFPSQGYEPEYEYSLTIEGLSKLMKINGNKTSRFCFVAMAFTTEMDDVYKGAIEYAITSTGFIPYIVNRINVDSDKTINDAIIAGIKKSRFTIADFTYHKDGVYFEAGYALGRGQKVIYTCRYDEMDKAHFDIRNYQHIVWTDVADFKLKLIDKIEAFVKD